MVSSFGQPEFTVTVITMWCHMVWNPASHLIEGTRKNSRSLSIKQNNNAATRRVSQEERTRSIFIVGHYSPKTKTPGLQHLTHLWEMWEPISLHKDPYLHGHTSVSFLSTGSQLASERQSSLWSEPKSSVSLPSDSFKHVWRKGEDINVIFTISNIYYYAPHTVLSALHVCLWLLLPSSCKGDCVHKA